MRAHADIGVLEMPPGSNRSPAIDEYNRRAGADLGSYWCASWAYCMMADAGVRSAVDMPGRFAAPSVREWVSFAKSFGRWKLPVAVPVPGDAVVYGDPTGKPEHIAIVTRGGPIICEVGGNTSLAGYSRNGVAVDFKAVDLPRVLGYVSPVASG